MAPRGSWDAHPRGTKRSPVALALDFCQERQRENPWEVVWIILDNFGNVYCHVKTSLRI